MDVLINDLISLHVACACYISYIYFCPGISLPVCMHGEIVGGQLQSPGGLVFARDHRLDNMENFKR